MRTIDTMPSARASVASSAGRRPVSDASTSMKPMMDDARKSEPRSDSARTSPGRRAPSACGVPAAASGLKWRSAATSNSCEARPKAPITVSSPVGPAGRGSLRRGSAAKTNVARKP